MTGGERIREIRKAAGLTQKQLGDRLGVTQATVQQYEGGKRNPKFDTLQRIAAALGVHVNDLIYNETDTVGMPNTRWHDLREKQKRGEATPEEKKEYMDLINRSVNSDPQLVRNIVETVLQLDLKNAEATLKYAEYLSAQQDKDTDT